MAAKELDYLGGVPGSTVSCSLGRLVGTKSDGLEVSSIGLSAINDFVKIGKSRLVEVVLALAERKAQGPGWTQGPIVSKGNVARSIFQSAIGGQVVNVECLVPEEGCRVGCGGVSKN